MKLSKKAQLFKILAPAGDWASLRTAINAGADFVYFGIKDFNMRSTGAKNFKISDIPKIVALCKKNKVKTYITVNTVLYNSDLKKMQKIISKAKESKCDGIIVSDFAAIQYAKKIKMPMCISTQLSISNIEAVKYFSRYADRIILARELSLKQIKEISKEIEKQKIKGPSGKLVEIEVFGHGALCVAISGRCNMSLFCYNTSANKGECSQICRRPYKVTDLETETELKVDNNYIMSPKDLCTIGLLPEIINSGVKVLKIEGRGRPPEYVDTVVRVYKKAIEAITEDNFTLKLIDELNQELKTVFNRGLSTGFYMGRKFDEWAKGDGNQAKTKRIFAGKVLHYFPQKKVALIRVLSKIELKKGDKCLIIGQKTGLVIFKLENMLVENSKVDKVKQNHDFTIKISKTVRKNDDVFVISKIKK